LVALAGGVSYYVRSEQQRIAAQEEQQRLEAAEKEANDDLGGLADFAAGTNVVSEIGGRFEMLEEAAKDEQLRSQLRAVNMALDTPAAWDALKERLKDLSHDNEVDAKADSWFINSASGTLVARTPAPKQKIIGENYAYRDYFHGQGSDKPRNTKPQPRPIEQPNISSVFKSTEDGHFKVAFSVPVKDDATSGTGEVLGVLSISIDLGKFTILQRSLSGRNQVVLVDMRENSFGTDSSARGYILHHPRLSDWLDQQDRERPPRVDEIVRAAVLAGKEPFVKGYKDPISPDQSELLWGAFRPVRGPFRKAISGGTAPGWIVLVQCPMPK
jgi:hypothetical protein